MRIISEEIEQDIAPDPETGALEDTIDEYDFDDFELFFGSTFGDASDDVVGEPFEPVGMTEPMLPVEAGRPRADEPLPADSPQNDDYRKQANIFNKVTGGARALVREPVVVVSIVILLIIVMFVRAFLVPSASMRPTLMEGDRILSMARYFPNGHTYQPGDIVCFLERHTNEVYVKRVVACGGDVVEIAGENVYVNGELSPYQGTGGMMTATRIILADDEYWVMGDNRGNSQDSRFIGPVKADQMISKVWCVYWPLDRFTWFGL